MTDSLKDKVFEAIRENDDLDWITYSELDGEDFLIFESWELVEKIEAIIKELDPDSSLDTLFDYNWGFSDEYTTCSDCYNVIRTSPDCYFWQADFWVGDGFILCKDCTQDASEDYLEDKVNNHRSFVNEDLVDLEAAGWTMIDIDFQNGMHSGMNSDPEKIAGILSAFNIDYLFTIQPSQFYVDFNVWVKTSDDDILSKLVTDILNNENTDLPYDIATELSNVLKGEHSDYYHVETHMISQEDFIAGNIP